jgi:hypothetical protein
MSTLRSAISQNARFSDRSELVVSLYENLIPLASLLADCAAFIMNPDINDEARHEALQQRVHMSPDNFLLWYHRDLPDPDQDKRRLPQHVKPVDSFARQLEILFTYQAGILTCNRFHVALDRDQGHIVECQSQEIAARMINLRDIPRTNVREGNAMISLAIARAVQATAEDWDVTGASSKFADPRPRVLIAPEKFRRWAELLGIRLHE